MTSPSLQIFKPAVAATLAIVIMCGLSVRPAQAGYIVTLEQVGSNVVATGSGALDLTGLTFSGVGTSLNSHINPAFAIIETGPVTLGDLYTGNISGPTNFGSGGNTIANSDSGDIVGIGSFQNVEVGVPNGYSSGGALSDSATYDNTNFTLLGATPGTYEWTWGIGANQNFTLQIGPPSVPDSGSTFGLLFLALIALFGAARFRSTQLA